MAETVTIIIEAKDRASSTIQGLDRSLTRLGGTVATAAAVGLGAVAAGMGALAVKAISAGSDVEETMGKFNAVFKEEAPGAIRELDNLAEAIGRNKFALRGYAATLQDTFVPLGFARDDAADMSVQLVALAEDLASFNNLDTGDVVRDLQSALVGNTETLRKYGVVASQAAIEAFALENAIWDGEEALTAQEKAAAILGLTLAGTADAQGDAARTAGSWANQMRGLRSTLEETVAEIGVELLPVLTPLLEKFGEFAREKGPQFAEAVGNVAEELATVAETFSFLRDNGIEFETALRTALTPMLGEGMAEKMAGFAEGFRDFVGAVETYIFLTENGIEPLEAFRVSLGTLIGQENATRLTNWVEIIEDAAEKHGELTAAANALGLKINTLLKPAVDDMMEGFSILGETISALWDVTRDNMPQIKDAINDAMLGALGIALQVGGAISGIVDAVNNLISAAQTAAGILGSPLPGTGGGGGGGFGDRGRSSGSSGGGTSGGGGGGGGVVNVTNNNTIVTPVDVEMVAYRTGQEAARRAF